MPTTVKTGWLKDKNGDKFAPKTLTSQVQTSDGTLIEDKIQADIDAAKEELAPLVGTTAEVTPAQVAEAVTSGRPVAITHTEAPFGSIQYCYFNVSEAMGVTLSTGVVDYIGGRIIIGLYGYIATGEWSLDVSSVIAEKDDIPDAVVNPTSASVGQTIVVDEVDANGKPTKWKAADYQERTHWVVKGSTPIIAEQEFTFNSSAQSSLSEALNIVDGETYVVVWDGVEYICECKSGTYENYPILYIGNEVVLGKEDDGIPFILGRIDVSGGISLIACLEPNTTHTAALYPSVVNKIPNRYLPKGVGYSEWVELLPETTLTFTNSQYQGAHNILIEPGKTYKVLWNGTEYILTASYFNLGTMAGNGLGNQAALGGTDTGEPFMLGTDVDGTALLCVELTGAASATVSIMVDEVTTIPLKYLPDGIGYEIIENVLPATSAAYVEDGADKYFYVRLSPELIIGQNYLVDLNGTVYNCTAWVPSDSNMKCLGNATIMGSEDYNNTGEPFCLFVWPAIGRTYIYMEDPIPSFLTVSITSVDRHRIPTKYLPDGIGYDNSEVILPLTDLRYVDESIDKYFVTDGFSNSLIADESYTVTYNGAAYTCIAKVPEGTTAVVLGNTGILPGLLGPETSDTNVPFLILSGSDASKLYLYTDDVYGDDGITTATLSIVRNELRKIPEKYLPDMVDKDAILAEAKAYADNHNASTAAHSDIRELIANHNHDDTYDTKGSAEAALVEAKAYADNLKELPMVTASDNGAFLRVVDGAWAATQLPNIEEGEY